MYPFQQNSIKPSPKSVRAAYQKAQRLIAGVPDHAKLADVFAPDGRLVSNTYYFEKQTLDKYA